MKSKYIIIFFLLSVLFPTCLTAKESVRSVAIVVDPITYSNCKEAIDGYSQSIKSDGLNPVIVIDKWGVPDSIRVVLKNLYKNNVLEGAVLVGDIPVPMIRNAQHLSTAFKMDQKRAWDLSSIPSDRFYDDFDLNFEFIKRDTTYKHLFYYNLAAVGPHNIRCDIYSARIKPPKVEGKDKYTLINEYLHKVVKEKSQKRSIRNLTFFAGHGYNSDDMVARLDEKVTLLDQFKVFRDGKGTLNYIDYTFDDFVKYRLMAEIAREDLDLAILHHHGAEDTQYMNGSPITSTTSRWIELARKFFRGKIRGSKDTTASKQYYIDNYQVPAEWVADAFNPEVMKKDSLEDAAIDITIPDLKDYKPNARFIAFDACFNGSFHLEDYISGHYIFNEGKTIVVKANSVNTLQDTWTNQLIGLLDLGVSVGNWAKGQMTLESHLIGDPTYRYSPAVPEFANLDANIVLKRNDIKYWRKNLNSNVNEVKSLSIKMLFEAGNMTTDELLSIQKSDKSPLIRLQAFNCIRKHYDKNLVSAIKLGLYDNYELIRRFSAIEAASNMSNELIEDVFAIRYAPGTSARVDFQLKAACESYPMDIAMDAFNRHVHQKNDLWYKNNDADKKALEYSLSRTKKEFEELMDPATPAKQKRFTITALRNTNTVAYIYTIFKFLKESKDDDLRITLAEALAWYTTSCKRDEIISVCEELLKTEKNKNLKFELNRTIQRLVNKPN